MNFAAAHAHDQFGGKCVLRRYDRRDFGNVPHKILDELSENFFFQPVQSRNFIDPGV